MDAPDRMPHVSVFAATLDTDAFGRDVLVVTGDVDLATAHEVVSAADAWTRSGAEGPVRIDLHGVTFLDSTGISALLQVRRLAASAGAEVVVVGRSPVVDRVFALAGIDDLFAAGADSE